MLVQGPIVVKVMECPFLPITTNCNNCLVRSFLTSRKRIITTCSHYGKLARNKNNNGYPNSPTLQQTRSHFLLTDSIRFRNQLSTQTRYQSILCCRSDCDNQIFDLDSSFLGWLRFLDYSWRLVSRSLLLCLFCFNLVGQAHGDPLSSSGYDCEDISSYYAPADHLQGEALLKKLNFIISNHKSLRYKEVWDALKILDSADVDNPKASSEVVEIYSSKVVSKLLAGKPEGWNREHLWPRSYGLTYGPSLTDLHNIRPADVNVNSSRGNKFYGECLVTSVHCLKPANKEAAFDTETDKERWAPPLQVRGDIARALMYMATCYGYNKSDGSPNLNLSDSPSIKNREMGLLSTLLKWNELDPPSREEQLRNNRVCSLYQHNRNPFVDHPEYADLIWKQTILGDQNLGSHSIYAWINEFYKILMRML